MQSKKTISIILASFLCLITTSCAPVLNNESETISIDTIPAASKGTACTLENNKGIWYVTATPESTLVLRSLHDLHIICERPGYKTTEKYLHASTPFLAFGNGAFGGLYGAGIDTAGGASYSYPPEVIIPMVELKIVPKPAKPEPVSHTNMQPSSSGGGKTEKIMRSNGK